MEGQVAQQEAKKQEGNNALDLSSLPAAFKFQVLSMLDQSTFNKAMEMQPEEKLPGFDFVKNLDPTKKAALKFFSEQDFASLDDPGYMYRDGFLAAPEKIKAINEEVQGLLERGDLKLAGMSQGQNKWNNSKARGDLHMWLHDKEKYASQCPHLFDLLEKMKQLQTELNETCNFESTQTQVQVACYPGEGARYVRHLDSFKGGSNRRITVLYYLNLEWKKEDGGELRIYNVAGENKEDHKDIEPLADRVLIFQSRVLEHEVLPAHSKRFSLTMWFY